MSDNEYFNTKMTAFQLAHGVRLTLEQRAALRVLLKEVRCDTRHACVEDINALRGRSHVFGHTCITKGDARDACMNASPQLKTEAPND